METKPNKTYTSIKQGLDEALKFSEGNVEDAAIHEFATSNLFYPFNAPAEQNKKCQDPQDK
ncbi:MAG: hypothetical protein K0Q78_2043 [Cellvibrio sp.]|jgi:hypothetical protein|nr:hypothetical protein [Cellvibrio sp.]